MEEKTRRVRWGVEQRLAFIEYRLFWEGTINRSDLMGFFGVSAPQASADLAQYQAFAPGNMAYDSTAKTYVALTEFQPRLQDTKSDDYLSDLLLLRAGLVTSSEFWPGKPPPFDVVTAVHRRIPSGTLRSVLAAIRLRHAINVQYQSLSRPQATWRWCSPHAIAFDGYRWHARVWCHERHEFRDFVLARVLAIGESRAADVDGCADMEWHRQVTLRIAPNPLLRPDHRRVVECDYGMTDGELRVESRVSQAFYFEALHVLDLKSESLPPKRQQVVLVNRDELDRARIEARQLTRAALVRAGTPVTMAHSDDSAAIDTD